MEIRPKRLENVHVKMKHRTTCQNKRGKQKAPKQRTKTKRTNKKKRKKKMCIEKRQKMLSFHGLHQNTTPSRQHQTKYHYSTILSATQAGLDQICGDYKDQILSLWRTQFSGNYARTGISNKLSCHDFVRTRWIVSRTKQGPRDTKSKNTQEKNQTTVLLVASFGKNKHKMISIDDGEFNKKKYLLLKSSVSLHDVRHKRGGWRKRKIQSVCQLITGYMHIYIHLWLACALRHFGNIVQEVNTQSGYHLDVITVAGGYIPYHF